MQDRVEDNRSDLYIISYRRGNRVERERERDVWRETHMQCVENDRQGRAGQGRFVWVLMRLIQ